MTHKVAVIIGAGPAGLTAAYELLARSDIQPIILEATPYIGGLSKTLHYQGNRIDLGGHRFFSKSKRVRDWWLSIFPLVSEPLEATSDNVLLIRQRHSHIYFLRKLFDYPLSLSWSTIRKLGVQRFFKIIASYLRVKLFPISQEKNLEDFFINRFGRELYETFFKDYTEKVWGKACSEVKPEWGSQRIKGLSILKAVSHSVCKRLHLESVATETSLIESFWYPKYGPGQLWEHVASEIQNRGGKILRNTSVVGLKREGNRVISVDGFCHETGHVIELQADYVFSSMPVKELIMAMEKYAPIDPEVLAIAKGLEYRDFVTVGLLLNKLTLKANNQAAAILDNWLYIQEKDVCVGRIQFYNNWSPYLVADTTKVWIGLEYFCNEQDAFWSQSDASIIQLALKELETLEIADSGDFIDGIVIRVPKAYPAYWGAYERFENVKTFLNSIDNLMVIGRNGMHKYNNSDHSMLTAMVAVDQLVSGTIDKDAIWQINTEQEYHETINP